nr:pectin acetylesterase 8-like [Ipomoea trifida]
MGLLGTLPPAYLFGEGFGEGNKVAVRYCDGSSFTGDVESVIQLLASTSEVGRRIFDAVLDDLLVNRGMKDATHVFLTGDSADPIQAQEMESMFRGVVDLHNSTGLLPEACKNRMKDNKELCMFPQYILKDIQTPLLIMNSPYDSYLILHQQLFLAYTIYFGLDKRNVKVVGDWYFQRRRQPRTGGYLIRYVTLLKAKV